MSKSARVSSFGQKFLQKMSNGNSGIILGDGRLKVGRLIGPATLARELYRLDLLAIEVDRVSLTAAGEAYLRRMKHLQKYCRSDKSLYPQNPYKAQHSVYRVEEQKVGKKSQKFVRNLGESPLAWLMKRKDKKGRPFLSLDQFEAGEKLSRDYEYAGMMTRTTSFYDGIPVSAKGSGKGSGEHQTVTQITARQRVEAALAHVGPGLSDILVRVCCYHEGLEQAEKNLSWPTRSGKLVLGLALDRLVDHYDPKNNHYG